MAAKVANYKKKESITAPRIIRNNFNLKQIKPLTDTQQKVYEVFNDNHLMLHGCAGTGKSFLSLYLALDALENDKQYKKIIIIRSATPTKSVGYIKGDLETKEGVYEIPYKDICSELYHRDDAYELLKTKGFIEFMTTSYIRGRNFNDSIVIFDEMQNATFHELDSVMTRIGENTKIIFCGDLKQSDLTKIDEKSGLTNFIKIIKCVGGFEYVNFTENDIVRSGIVKKYLIEKSKLGFL